MAPLLKAAPFLLLALASAAKTQMQLQQRANPVRKVVMMLQMITKKVEGEGKKAEEMFDKFMCFCQNGDETLGKSIEDAGVKIPQLESSIGEAAPQRSQLEADLKEHRADRKGAGDAISEADSIRDKEAHAYAEESTELSSNIEALRQSIAAIEKGTVGGFLQSKQSMVKTLQRVSVQMDMSDHDRESLAAFLGEDSDSGYAPQSDEILGILKQMKDEMEKDLKDATEAEESAIAEYHSLVDAKSKVIRSLSQAIEDKLGRVGTLGVQLAEMQNDLEDTQESLAEDKAFLADLKKNCKTKRDEYKEYRKQQTLELAALADTIKLLNDDDALELFKKTLPSSASLLQVQVSMRAMRQQALLALKAARHPQKRMDPRVDMLEMAIRGKTAGFSPVVEMIDKLVAMLKKEQADDDKKKGWCEAEFDKSDDEKKGLVQDVSDINKAIDDEQEAIDTMVGEIAALTSSVKELDKSVVEATGQRKAEHAAYVEDFAALNAAKDLLEMAKNRLNQFYNPKLYRAPPKRDLTEEESIAVNMGGTLAPTAPPSGIAGTDISAAASFAQVRVHRAAATQPEAFISYRKSSETATGVLHMIELLKRDLEKQISEMKANEKDAQVDYEDFMKDAADKRALDSKAITDKDQSKAELDGKQEGNKASLKDKREELMGTEKYIADLHVECDWLITNFDMRAQARANEVDALGKAKDVLRGADYSL